ncbi:MAG: oxamate carbamoyltransferase subunit AllH family protein [Dermatophilaceae bacterium]
MTAQAPPREVLGASSPLTRTVVIGPWRQGLVLASFPTALYLSVGAHHEVLPVLASDALVLPTAVRLSAAGRELDWGVEPGDTVTVGRSEMRTPALRVRLVREWRPARVRAVPNLAEPGLLFEVADLLSCQLLPSYVRTPELVDQATAVCRAARCADDAAVRRGVRQMLGAGQGLTPSGDDVLCTVLLVLNGVGDAPAVALLGAAVQDRWTATTSLSASLLDAARKGYAVPEVATLVERALRGDLAGAREALTSTLAIGHSSGQDLVAGLAGSLRVLADVHSPIPHR